MTVIQMVDVRCRQCGAEFEALHYESINFNLHPHLRDEDALREATTVTCPVCGSSGRLAPTLEVDGDVWTFVGGDEQ